MNEREANQMLSVYASYIRAGNAKEAGELATKIVRLLAAAGMSAEGGEAKDDAYEQDLWLRELFHLIEAWRDTRDGTPSKAEAFNALWKHAHNIGPNWRSRAYLAASPKARTEPKLPTANIDGQTVILLADVLFPPESGSRTQVEQRQEGGE